MKRYNERGESPSLNMIYLYFNRDEKVLYAYDNLMLMASNSFQVKWEGIDTVTADHEKGQIVAHEMDEGKVVEFPIQATVLSCKEAVNTNK